ncbi:HEAT repeat domain-containing protein [Bdellovibrionota bacterium FG-1]
MGDNVKSDKVLGAMVKNGSVLLRCAGKSLGCVQAGFQSVVQGTRRLTGASASGMKGLFTGGLRKKQGLNRSEVKTRIATLENDIREGYLKVGKLGSGVENKEQLFEVPEIREVVEKIKILENQLNSLKKYQLKLENAELQNVPADAVAFDESAGLGTSGDKSKKKIKHAIEDGLKKAKFQLQSDAIIFRKALYDLLDHEMEIKRLAASELGKLGNKHAGPALKAALEYGDPQLQAEIISSLVRLEDRDTFSICKDFVKHEYAPIRTASIRGLYKAGRNNSVPYLIDGLKDDSVEVRNSSAMFLGWCEAPTAVPALLQAASDADRRVRKSAILSLSNIRDEASVLPLIRLLDEDDEDLRKATLTAIERIGGVPVPFKGGEKADRTAHVEELKEWWISKMYEGPAPVSSSSPSGGAAE